MKQKMLGVVVAGLVLCGSAAGFACDKHGAKASSEPSEEDVVTASAGESGEAQDAKAKTQKKAAPKKEEKAREGTKS